MWRCYTDSLLRSWQLNPKLIEKHGFNNMGQQITQQEYPWTSSEDIVPRSHHLKTWEFALACEITLFIGL
jgi:hypothetical protein